MLGGKVQGFCGKTAKILALEQRIIVLKALDFKDIRVVQYTLYIYKSNRMVKELVFHTQTLLYRLCK